jgi:uncharacterized protein involved in response to NO
VDTIPNLSPSPPANVLRWSPLALGFRPFFLLAGIAATLLMALWLLVLHGGGSPLLRTGSAQWHGHERLFGYVAAVIAGFLLTAVRNWTGIATWTGWQLALLVAVWTAGRLLPWLADVPVWLAASVDGLFLPLVAVSLFRPLWRGRNRGNRLFLPILVAMGGLSLLSNLQLAGMESIFGDARRVMLDLVLLVLVIVAGRVLPFFTGKVLPGYRGGARTSIERLTVGGMLILTMADLFPLLPVEVHAALWLVFAVVQAARSFLWFDHRVWRMSILWILHLGYFWLCIGAALNALGLVGWFPSTAALHALGAGAVGVFTLGMMARVTRGHTGRSINVPADTRLAFVALNLAVALRVFGPAWWPQLSMLWFDMAGGLWILTFLLFVWRYAPMLLQSRVDGAPG